MFNLIYPLPLLNQVGAANTDMRNKNKTHSVSCGRRFVPHVRMFTTAHQCTFAEPHSPGRRVTR